MRHVFGFWWTWMNLNVSLRRRCWLSYFKEDFVIEALTNAIYQMQKRWFYQKKAQIKLNSTKFPLNFNQKRPKIPSSHFCSLTSHPKAAPKLNSIGIKFINNWNQLKSMQKNWRVVSKIINNCKHDWKWPANVYSSKKRNSQIKW